MSANEAVRIGRGSGEPALHSKVIVTQQEAGVTLDFPLFVDGDLKARRRTWRTFEVGILLLVGSVACFFACWLAGWLVIIPMLPLIFFAGIFALIAAANRMWWARNYARGDHFLCQLAVVGNLLIRRWGDHRKEIWYREEIRDIKVEDKLESTAQERDDGGQTYLTTYAFWLAIEMQSGEKIILLGDGTSLPFDENRPKPEMEWIATVLRQALNAEPMESPAPPQAISEEGASSQAIQEIPGRAKETRIVP
jgi:hypothetical protein